MNLIGKTINNKYHIIKKVGEGGMSTVWLAQERLENRHIAIKVLNKDVTSNRIEDIIRFRNEANTVAKLNSPYIAKVFEVGETEDLHYMAMEYLKGDTLENMLKSGKPFTIGQTIEFIYRLCEALKCIHSAHILHRDLKPGNIIINDNDSLDIKLIDFGLAQIREFNTNAAKELVGTLYYMSPEQSGVIKRMVDERSDIYSLGVIFYQLLTQELPFRGDNISTILYQHAAKTPDRPTRLNKEIPSILEAIVLKLLEKEPEKRYQSVDGLLKDIEKYKNGQETFTPGYSDKIVNLNYRTNLIGRDEELSKLKKLFDNASNSCGSICLIGGEAGKGKTRLVEELRSYVYEKRGTFIDGKCFSGENKIPYSVFKEAINTYLKAYDNYKDEKKNELNEKMRECVGNLGRAVLKLNPMADVILGECPDLIELQPNSENDRFLKVVSDFFCGLGSASGTLVIMLDDLQWLDEGSMGLLKGILYQISKYPVLLIGTYRDDEVTDGHILQQFIRVEKDSGKPLHQIMLKAFDDERMRNFISNLLYDKGENIKEISEFILKKSKGNPFFSIEILKQLVNESAILHKEGVWQINKEAFGKTEIPSNMIDMLMKRIAELEDNEKEVLIHAAVIGKKFDIELLFNLVELSEEEVVAAVDRAIGVQLLEQDSAEMRKIIFVHDRIREAFYKSINGEKLRELHLKIAHTLETYYRDNLDKAVFELAEHYVESRDIDKALEYVYPAAIKAKDSYANEVAIRYFLLAADYLEINGNGHSDRRIDSIKSAGELYVFIGKSDEALILFEKLLPIVKDTFKKAEIFQQMSQAYFRLGNYKKSIEHFRQGLLLVGEKFPASTHGIIAGIIKEFIVLRIHECFPPSISIEGQSENSRRVTMYQLSAFEDNSLIFLFSDLLSHIYMVLKGLNLSESRVGKSNSLVLALGGMGVTLGGATRFKASIEYFEKAINIGKEIGNDYLLGEIYSMYGYMLMWMGEFEKSKECLLECIKLYKSLGNYQGVVLGLSNLCSVSISLGQYSEAESYIELLAEYSSRSVEVFPISMTYFMKAWHCLEQGKLVESEEYALESYRLVYQKEPLCEYLTSSLLGNIYVQKEDIGKAVEYTEYAKKVHESNKLMRMYTDNLFAYLAEVYIAKVVSIENISSEKERGKLLGAIKENCVFALRKTKKWPVKYGHALRVNAKYSALINDNRKAEKLFLQAIEHFKKYKVKYSIALGYFEYSIFLKNIGRLDEAKKSTEYAYNLFKEIKSELYIKKCEAQLGIDGQQSSDSIERFSQGIRYSQRMSSIISMSQQISSILNLDLLLEKVMDLAIEVTGAQNGYLMLKDKKTGFMRTVVSKRNEGSLEAATDISENIVNKVLETGESVITINAAEDEKYISFHSVVTSAAKSVLCIPIKYYDEINGVCYLTNQLSSAVFTKEDVDILNVFITQAAISIKNAELYRMAITDGLTELITHKHFKTLLDKEIESQQKYNGVFSLIMFDIDHFKKFNDTYGHQAGDHVLVNISKITKENFRTVDAIARYGGEEFAVILPDMDVNAAKVHAERLRQAVEDMELTYSGIQIKVTISLGVAAFPHHASSQSSLINAADSALYKSKEAGRNRVTVFEEL
ncbi:MAG: diguanylate cyclase [Clostridia bacterium]|nr:diguanylate cyclase [Clostridia bacterium]